MNVNGSTESSEGILNSTNVPFTTFLNIPLGIGNPPLDSSSSMITPPPASDISSNRNENHSFDALATPTSISSAHLSSLRAQQHLNYANAARLLQSPSDYFGLLNSLIRQHQESPPTPSLQPNSDSVLSLWPNSAVEGYLEFINTLIRQHQQDSPPTFAHSTSVGSVRSLWPTNTIEDDGSHLRSAPYHLSYPYGSREHYARSPSRIDPHLPLESCSPIGGNATSSATSCSPKSPRRRNGPSPNVQSFSPKSPSRANASAPSCSPKSPSGSSNNVNPFLSRSPSRANSTTKSCSPKSPSRFHIPQSTCSLKSPSRVNSTREPCSPKSPRMTNNPTVSPASCKSSLSGTIFETASPSKIMFSAETLSSPLSLTIGTSATDDLSTGITSSPLIIPVIHRLNKEQTLSRSNNGDHTSTFDSSPIAEKNTRLRADATEEKNISHVRSPEGWTSPVTKPMRHYSELSCPVLAREPNNYEEEKIDVWSVKDSLLLKVVEPHQISKDTVDSESESRDTEPGSPQIHSQLGAECSRTVPSLMKFYSRHKLSLNSSSSLSINLAVAGQATPPCSPISPGTHNATILPSNTLGFPISPALIIQPGITSLSSPTCTGTYNVIPHNSSTLQTSIQGPLNVSIPTYASTQISLSPRKSSSSFSQCAQIKPSNAKILSLEASTMTSPMERSSELTALSSSSSPNSKKYFETNASTATRNSVTTLTTQVNEINRTRQSSIEALTVLTVPTVISSSTLYSPVSASPHSKLMTSPPIKPTKKLKSAESDQSAFSHVNLNVPLNHSASMPLPTTTTSASTMGPIHTGMNYASPWSIPNNPLAHPGSYWLPPSQYSSVDPGVGAASLSLGYHIARDQLTGHLYLLPRPHPLSDHSSHSLMWAGYGGMAPPPVVMSPQQLLLGDPHFRHAIHPPLMHVHHPSTVHSSSQSSKNRESPSITPKDAKKAISPIIGSRSPSAAELSLPPPLPTPHYLYPPTTLPYYYSQPPHHSYSIPGFPPHGSTQPIGMPTNLIQTITTIPFTTSTPTLTTAAATLTPLTVTTSHSNVKISSSASSSVWSRGSDIPISSPGLHHESLMERISDPYSDPPMDLTQRRSKSPQYQKEISETKTCSSRSKLSFKNSLSQQNSKIGVATPKPTKPIVIKKEIKEEVLSPPLLNSEEDIAHEPKIKPNIKVELNKTFSHLGVSDENVISCQETNVSIPCSEHKPNSSNVHELTPLNDMEQASEEVANTKTPLPKNDIDSSGLELLFQTFLQHGDRLAPSPSEDMDSNSSHSEQMPHLERAAKTPSPRCSPCSYESLPPVLTPFATTPNVPRESASGAPSPVSSPPPMDIYPLVELMPPQPEPLSSPQQSKANCFSVLCALAEQRILEEQQNNCSALSSLAEVALAIPSVPTELPLYSTAGLVPTSIAETYKDQTFIDGEYSGNEPSEASTSFSETAAQQFQANESNRATDINRNYKSPESEREVKAFIANKVSQYHKDYMTETNSLLPNYQIDEMDPSEIDMRMKLADIQRQYKEKQLELSKLFPKKDMYTPFKRGRGRPPKPKLTSPIPGIKRKVGRPHKKSTEEEESIGSPKENESIEAHNNENGDIPLELVEAKSLPQFQHQSPLQSQSPHQSRFQSQSPHQSPFQSPYQSPYQSPLESPFQSPHHSPFQSPHHSPFQSPHHSPLQSPHHSPFQSPHHSPFQSHHSPHQSPLERNEERSFLTNCGNKNRIEETSDYEVYSPTKDLDLTFKPPTSHIQDMKHEDSDDDARSEISLSKIENVQPHTETSVESSTSDAEIHVSSSKKRKPGRPKKHSPTKYDGTETIVAKNSKSLGFMLLQKSKIRPKLKAELKIRDSEEENDEENDFHHHASNYEDISEEEQEDSNPKPSKHTSVSHSKGSLSISKKTTLCTQHHGAPRGRSSLSRNTILRDKEKRKTAFEKNSQMQQLFRSLKRHSKVADPEHDESGDEREDNYSDEDEIERKENQDLTNNQEPHIKDLINLSNSTSLETTSQPLTNHDNCEPTVVVKKEDDICDSGPIEDLSKIITPVQDSVIKEEIDNELEEKEGESNVMNPEKEKEISVCSLQVEDLVQGARVLVLQDGLLYAGALVPLNPPDVYDVRIDGERGTKQHICCLEDLILRSWKEVKPGSTRFLTEGTRVCAFWSQQYRGLYPGSVAAASSPTHEGNHNLVNVEFDDGDSGRIHVDDIRLLPSDFPVVDYDPNPLITLNKRKRRPTEEDSTERKSPENVKQKRQENGTDPPKCKNLNKKIKKKDNKIRIDKENETILKTKTQVKKSTQPNLKTANEEEAVGVTDSMVDKAVKKIEVQKWTTDQFLLHTGDKTAKRRRALSLPSSGKKHKKRHHSDKHRHRHKKRRWTLEDYRIHPHIEQGDNELRMRIKSPPPMQEEFLPTQFEYLESSSSEEEELPVEKQNKTQKKPQRRNKRSPSEKSKIAPFLPEKQLWKWSGKGYKRPGGKGKGKKEFYKEIVRGKERIRVGDCAVFLSSGSPERPFIGKIDFLWEGWGGNMVVKVRWFYHPDETKEAERNLADPRDALFSSSHTDENDVQTISHRCDVFSLADYRLKKAEIDSQKGSESENNDLYYLAGYYDTTYGRITMEPGVS